jgi:hypothetical protein
MQFVRDAVRVLLLVLLGSVTLAQAQSEQRQKPMGARIANTRINGHNVVLMVENTSSKDITAVHIVTDINYQRGGTAGPSWLLDFAWAKADREWKLAHRIAPGSAPQIGVLHPGETVEVPLDAPHFPNVEDPIARFTATVDAVVYADGSADVQDPEAYRSLIVGRRGLAGQVAPTVEPDVPKNSSASAARTAKDDFFSKTGFPTVQRLNTATPFPTITIPSTTLSSLPALPVQQSDAILIGTVIERKAFLAKDNQGVYSEMQIQVELVLKGNITAKTITVQRPGGAAYFNDGTLQVYKVADQDWPALRKRYVLFLQNSQAVDFDLLTGYELRAGFTYPLDGPSNPSLPFRAYYGMKESDFMSALSKALGQQGGN